MNINLSLTLFFYKLIKMNKTRSFCTVDQNSINIQNIFRHIFKLLVTDNEKWNATLTRMLNTKQKFNKISTILIKLI